MRRPITPLEAISERTHVTDEGCWEWLLYRNQDGYGIWCYGGKRGFAHRMSYEYLVGPLPPRTEIDHLCRNRLCVNPAHLEPVLHRENVLRGESPSARHATKTHCPKGHPYDAGNTGIVKRRGGLVARYCRTCRRKGPRVYVAKTHCPAGHAYEGDNLIVNGRGHRMCRTCRNERARLAMRAKRLG